MNTRIENILKEFEKNQLCPDQPFKFHCTMCGKCCINMEKPFEPQFRVHADELCKMIRELSGEEVI